MDWSTIASEIARSVAVVAAINIPIAVFVLLLALAGKKKVGQHPRAAIVKRKLTNPKATKLPP